jgi:hypothetical protein
MKCFRLDMKTQQRSVFSQTNLLKLFKFWTNSLKTISCVM